jgi:hypothetical protein
VVAVAAGHWDEEERKGPQMARTKEAGGANVRRRKRREAVLQ